MKSPPWFDLPMACLGALVSGTLVAWVNSEHGLAGATTAALKQACYAFLATGLIMQFSRWLASRPVHPVKAVGTAIVVPLLITMTLLYFVHSLKGTPEPLYSILPGTVLSFMGLLIASWQSHRH